MRRLCWEKYIIDEKFDGWYIWKRTSPFIYKEIAAGVESVIPYLDGSIERTAEHILTKKQADGWKNKVGKYTASYQTHIEVSQKQINENNSNFDYGSYEDFVSELSKRELAGLWEREHKYPESYFSPVPLPENIAQQVAHATY